MALDPGNIQRPSSPASSDASTPVASRSHARDQEDLLKKDKAYRRYAAGVERALSLFDTALQEWADYISFLGRLLKALQAHPPNLAVVPNKATVAKRLAQCLNPALPSGVHQKALEVYSYVFTLLKQDGLSRDLHLYLPGISSTLTFASLSVRPLFLSLVETHLLNLYPTALRPALKAIVLSLLPGLEEETSEDFERTLRILDKFKAVCGPTNSSISETKSTIGASYFWQCLFLASITNPSRRLGVLAYLNRHLPKLGTSNSRKPSITIKENGHDTSADLSTETDAVTSPEPGLLVRCFATGLADEQLLIQRNFLDLLVTHLPLHSPMFQQSVTSEDLERLVTAAAGVVTRRDMSLNRRLWTWFLGPETSKEAQGDGSPGSPESIARSEMEISNDSADLPKSRYFSHYGLQPLVKSIKSMINRNAVAPPERARPYRISLSLMDRWEVGGLVVPAVFLEILRSVQKYERLSVSRDQFDEVFRSASVFFDGVESGLIWSEILGLLRLPSSDLSSNLQAIIENLELATFTITSFNVREEEMLVIHVPLATLALLIMIGNMVSASDDGATTLHDRKAVLVEAFKALNQLVELVTGRAFLMDSSTTPSSVLGRQHHRWIVSRDEILKGIRKFYAQSQETLELTSPPFSPRDCGDLILREAAHLVLLETNFKSLTSTFKDRVNVLISLIHKLPESDILRKERLFEMMLERLFIEDYDRADTSSFSVISSITLLLTTLYSARSHGYYITQEQVCEIVPVLVQRLWIFLTPSSPRFHVETVRCLWQLQSISWQERSVEAKITSLMISSDSTDVLHITNQIQAERFVVLWSHSGTSSIEASDGSSSSPRSNKRIGDTNQVIDKSNKNSTMLDRPLFLVLDLLSNEASTAHTVAEDWIRNLRSVKTIIRLVITRFSNLSYLQEHGHVAPEASADNGESCTDENLDDVDACCYYLQTLSNILLALSSDGWLSIANESMAWRDGMSTAAEANDEMPMATLQVAIVQLSLRLLALDNAPPNSSSRMKESHLHRAALSVIRQLLNGPHSEQLIELKLDTLLIDRLLSTTNPKNKGLQSALIDTLLAALKISYMNKMLSTPPAPSKHRRTTSKETITSTVRLSLSTDQGEKELPPAPPPSPPPQLFECLLKGLSSSSSCTVLEKWVFLLCECLPLYSRVIFQILLPLVECFCKQIRQTFCELQAIFLGTSIVETGNAELDSIVLLNGLEYSIARAHDRLMTDELSLASAKSPEQPQGFFGNMVSGVFTTEGNQARSAAANNRLTVLLCFQDAVRVCFEIWSWGSLGRGGSFQDADSMASFQYISLRMRNRARRILEHLFAAEALECLETLVEIWSQSSVSGKASEASSIFNLLHTLDGSRPKNTIPAIFNAIYSRTNPTALDPTRKSTLSSTLSDADLIAFLVTYARSLEDDVLDEIWTDCMTFLRDVLANPFPHRQILSRLLEFTAILGEKMENTNFGEERKMRREVGVREELKTYPIRLSLKTNERQELFMRLLTAIFTIKPIVSSQDAILPPRSERPSADGGGASLNSFTHDHIGSADVVDVLAKTLPSFASILGDSDRIMTTMSSISLNITGPLFRSRLFPQNINKSTLELLYQVSKVSSSSKAWKKDISDSFNDSRFFQNSVELVKGGWLGLLRQWTLNDKDRLQELLSRVSSPASAGIVFGVGATATRLEADRKTQLNLRRIAVLVLAADDDTFTGDLSALQEKLEDLITATSVSSPSSSTRAEAFMVLRSIVLKTSSIHLAPFWPIINAELNDAIYSVSADQSSETYNPYSVLQACKLLDILLLIAPDDFQLQEWLFVTDTIDAVYRPDRWESVALVDEVSRSLGHRTAPSTSHLSQAAVISHGLKKPWLSSAHIRSISKEEILEKLLRPFFDQLSIHAFESTYSLGVPDMEACKDDLLADLLNEGTIAA